MQVLFYNRKYGRCLINLPEDQEYLFYSNHKLSDANGAPLVLRSNGEHIALSEFGIYLDVNHIEKRSAEWEFYRAVVEEIYRLIIEEDVHCIDVEKVKDDLFEKYRDSWIKAGYIPYIPTITG